MKIYLLSSFLISSSLIMAQITIDSGDFADGGDTAMVSVSTDFGLDFTSSGTDYVWDYSALIMDSQRIDTFFKIETASVTYQLVFNNGWFDPDYQADYYQPLLNFALPSTDFIGVSIENPVGFTKIETDRVEIVGVGLEIGGIQVPIKNDIIDLEYELPLNYDDNWVSNSLFEIDLNPAFDGILRRHQERTTQVDGWGTITTPYGTFDVIRTVAYLDFTDSLRLSIGGGDPTWTELPTPSQIVYSWWAKDQKIPILEVVARDFLGSETVTSVEYKDRYLGDVGLEETVLKTAVIYPNPTSDLVQIMTNETIQNIELYSFDGRLLTNANWDNVANHMDVSNLAAGNYILKIQLAGGVITEQLIIE